MEDFPFSPLVVVEAPAAAADTDPAEADEVKISTEDWLPSLAAVKAEKREEKFE